MSEKYQAYLKTDYWKAVSDAVKKRAGYRCQFCNSQHDLQAHHRTYEHRGKELNHLDDMTCLCRRCHGVFHGTITTPKPVEAVAAAEPERRALTKSQRRAQREKLRAGMTNVRPHTEAEIDHQMPDGEEITLSHELINRLRANGSFTTATMKALGLPTWGNGYGWVNRLVGNKVDRSKFRAALKGKYIYSKLRFPISENKI